jgi:hypothetical protein
MKRDNAILSLYQKHAAKVKKNACSSSPTARASPIVEGLAEGQNVVGEGLTEGSGTQAPVQPPMDQPEVNVVVLAATTDVNPTPSAVQLESSNGSKVEGRWMGTIPSKGEFILPTTCHQSSYARC